MVIDSSALLAILLGEPEAQAFARSIADDPTRLLSAVSALETAIVIQTKKGRPGGVELDLLMHKAQIEIVAMDTEQVGLARAAYDKFGKGHPARLNLGDCCAYALSRSSGEPLLYRGEDFSRTDVPRVPC
ncbi:MAG: type II toxin-antitoxin system VapC family toxin [Deltaproteobacteria bacterium]|nr:type II toxin-antitoxin system VapC family toxin [Deltaproteobacteria bacterium]